MSKILRNGTLGMVLACLGCGSLLAQGPAASAPGESMLVADPVIVAPPRSEHTHKFFDRWNVALFAGAGALNAADFGVTRANLQNGGRELNPMVRVFGRSSTGLAVNFAGEAVGTMGISYFFHKTGHHRLERIAPLVNIGTSSAAVAYSLMHR